MRLRWRIGVVTAALAAAVTAGAVQHRSSITPPERAARLQMAMSSWQHGFQRDLERLAALRRDAEAQLDRMTLELSRMQSRIVRLDALARRVVERTELEREEFDFGREPALGGPEAAWADDGESGDAADLRAAVESLALQLDDRSRQLEVLDDLLKWRELSAAVHPEGRPVRAAYVSSRYGARIDPFTGKPAAHQGMDFAGREGTEIVAVAAGIVTWSGPHSGYGNMIEIDHGNQHATRYAHNAENLVAVGDVVTRGQAIAKLGSTGRATGPNLHFEVLQDGRAVNPLPYIK